ncbi:hypothetical protein [Curtanaerobium respiraculi]|uniref:hypothetical protein n=1 Tax=Curtanaerobium respiraculi TaxID=2949669 RepID=UPI0024B35BAB|nr:hypothetical protein [Curtanaerobium respiraculi]
MLDEEDDVVIQAGAVPASEPVDASGVPPAKNPPREPKSACEGEGEAASESKSAAPPRFPDVSEETAALLEDADDEARAEFALHMKQKRAREAEQLLTTEEDLHKKAPFHTMRVWILVIAALVAIAFIVYWNVSIGS